MSYKVKKLAIGSDEHNRFLLQGNQLFSYSFAVSKMMHKCPIENNIALFVKSEEGNSTKHTVIVLSQLVAAIDDCTNIALSGSLHRSTAFVLYSSEFFHSLELQDCNAFIRIVETLSPFLACGTVMMSVMLLETILLPDPIHPLALVNRLTSFLELNPLGHHNWNIVIQSLMNGIVRLKEHSRNKLKALITMAKLSSLGFVNLFLLPLLIAVPLNSSGLVDLSNDYHHLPIMAELDCSNGVYYQQVSKTMLMEAVENNLMQSCLFITASGVDTNEKEISTGDTALHIAVRKDNITIVKLLLTYGADSSLLNDVGESPLSIAESNIEIKSQHAIVESMHRIHELKVVANKYNTEHQDVPAKRNSSDVFLLAIDGGGMKTLNSAQTLEHIENRMRALGGPDSALWSSFDYFAGTSAGGAISTFIAHQGSVQSMRSNLIMLIHAVVRKPFKDRQASMKQFLFERYNENEVLANIDHGKKLIILTTLGNVMPYKLHIMSSYGESRDGKPGPQERKIWEAIAASVAAPTIFPPHADCFLDGGLVANNPTLIGMSEIFENESAEKGECKLGCVVSIGSGSCRTTLDNAGSISNSVSFNALADSLVGIKNLFNHLIVNAGCRNSEEIQIAKSWCQSVGASYYRLSPKLLKYTPMNNSDVNELALMMYETEIYLLEQHKTIDDIAKKLLSK